MTTFTKQITSTVNDGFDDGSTYSATGVQAGVSTATYTAGLRFVSVTVPNATTVSSATLSIFSGGADTATTATLHGVATDNAAQFSDSNLPSLQGKTSASASVPHGDVAGTGYMVNVTTVAQEILSRGGWANGNALAFVIEATGGTPTWGDWEQIGRPSATLTIVYSGGSSTYNEVVDETVTAAADVNGTIATNSITEVAVAAASFSATVTCRASLTEAATPAMALTVTYTGWTYDSPAATSWNLSSAAESIWTPIAPTSTDWT